MARLIAHNPQKARLKSVGYRGDPTGTIEITENGTYDVKAYAYANVDTPQPEGNIDLTENNVQVNVAPYKYATPKIPEPSGTKEITENGLYDVFDYAEADVQIPPPKLEEKQVTPSTTSFDVEPSQGYDGLSKVTVNATPLESKTITPTTQQQTVTPTSPNIGLSSVTVEGYVPPVEPEWKYVNFIDYDGTLLYSYTKEEVYALTEMPPLPVREGYTYQKWNWTLTTLKQSGKQIVGAVRMTSDGSTQLTFDLCYGGNLTIPLIFQLQNDEIVVNWGDGTSDNFANLTSSYSSINTSHTYQNYGRYTISMRLKNKTGYYKFINYVFGSAVNNSALIDVCIGEYVTSFLNAFKSCISLKGISMPDLPYLSMGQMEFQYACVPAFVYPKDTDGGTAGAKIKIISLAEGTLTTHNLVDSGYLKILCLPWSITELSSYGLRQCGIISSPIVIPKSVTSIGNYALTGLQAPYGTKAIKFVDLSLFDDPTALPILAGTSSFEWVETFLVKNQTMLDAFEGATNWSAYAGQYQIGGEYAEVTP